MSPRRKLCLLTVGWGLFGPGLFIFGLWGLLSAASEAVSPTQLNHPPHWGSMALSGAMILGGAFVTWVAYSTLRDLRSPSTTPARPGAANPPA